MKKKILSITIVMLIFLICTIKDNQLVKRKFWYNEVPDSSFLIPPGVLSYEEGIKYTKEHGLIGSNQNDAHKHNYKSTITKEPTCNEEGVITYTCESCGKSYTEPIPKTDHTWEETIITPATCSTEGKVKKVCSVCGEEVVEVIPCNPEVHDYEEVIVKEPTCTEDGIAKKVCKGCGAETEEYAIPALGHKYEEAITKEPTCTEPGIKTFTCANCGDTYTEEIPALGHDEESKYVYKAKIGSLVFDGKTVYTCKRCGEIREEADPNSYPLIYLISTCALAVVIISIIVILVIIKNRKAKGAVAVLN